MGGTLEDDLELLVREGLFSSFDSLQALRLLRTYLARGGTDTAAQGAPVLRHLLEDALTDWHRDPEAPGKQTVHAYRDSMKALLALGQEGKRTLNGEEGLRGRAGRHLGVGYDQFGRQYHKPVVKAFADWLPVWDLQSRQTAAIAEPSTMTWEMITNVCGRVSRQIEMDWKPDFVLTMSGPGSIAALYSMKIAARDVPVLMAVTFPRREPMRREERDFQRASGSAGWPAVETTKWKVYVPDVVRHYEPGSVGVIFDDRVISGTTQQLVKEYLSGLGLSVYCCALFAPEARREQMDFVGRYIEGEFEMPWGDQRGRR